MVAQIIIQLVVNIQNSSLIYYCNWVLGTYNDGVTQTIGTSTGKDTKYAQFYQRSVSLASAT